MEGEFGGSWRGPPRARYQDWPRRSPGRRRLISNPCAKPSAPSAPATRSPRLTPSPGSTSGGKPPRRRSGRAPPPSRPLHARRRCGSRIQIRRSGDWQPAEVESVVILYARGKADFFDDPRAPWTPSVARLEVTPYGVQHLLNLTGIGITHLCGDIEEFDAARIEMIAPTRIVRRRLLDDYAVYAGAR